jgi:glutamyl-tRNA synthetase
MSKEVRVRFAPSPTGHLHIGNVRAAILNWVYARKYDGRFVLRIEDTDVERSTEESMQSIMEDLRWLGLLWDEGPDVGGPYGPYRQSQRQGIYREHLKMLKAGGSVYPCYCTPDELAIMREIALRNKQTPRYNGRCRNLTESQRRALEAEGRKPVLRYKVPAGEIGWKDLIKGEITFDGETIGDFVVARSDGGPVYNFACVVDDHLMRISHVLRGDDHVSNTPRQLLLYRAFGWEQPQFGHLPMILGPDRTRLSKRHGATSLDYFIEKGYLPEAIINYLSLLSWSSETGEEILSIERLIEEFDLDRVGRSPAVFDLVKLTWLNGQYVRKLDVDRLTELVLPYLRQAPNLEVPEDDQVIRRVVEAVKDKLNILSDIVEVAAAFFQREVEPEDGEAREILKRETSQKVFWSFHRHLEQYDRLDRDLFRQIMKQVGKETGVTGKELWMPIRVALTGQTHGPELPLVAEILDHERCRQLISKVLKR